MEKGKVLWRVFNREEKWNGAYLAVKSQFEVVDVLSEQQEAIKSFFRGLEGSGGHGVKKLITVQIKFQIISEIRMCEAANLSSS